MPSDDEDLYEEFWHSPMYDIPFLLFLPGVFVFGFSLRVVVPLLLAFQCHQLAKAVQGVEEGWADSYVSGSIRSH